MSSITRLMHEIQHGSERSNAELFSAVYEELRLFARQLMEKERPDHTLGATALVHEVYLRLSGGDSKSWKNRAYFFSAAAESMRRILVEHARQKKAQRYGGLHKHEDLEYAKLTAGQAPEAQITDLLTLDELISKLAVDYPEKAELVKLLYFAGLSLDEAAAVLGTSRTSTYRQWLFVRGWLRRSMSASDALLTTEDSIPDKPSALLPE